VNPQSEIDALSAETIATQILVAQVLFRLAKVEPKLADAIRQAFDDASHILEQTAYQSAEGLGPDEATKAMRIVDELRENVFGPIKGPKPLV